MKKTRKNEIIDETQKREISLERAAELKSKIQDYLTKRNEIPEGLKMEEEIKKSRKKILKILGGTESDWEDYRWQLSKRISDVETLSMILNLSDKEIDGIRKAGMKYRWAISPYYASLMDPDNPYCPVRLQAVPSALEISYDYGRADPMMEEYTNPAGTITRRYPDRLIINMTNECAMYCRHCQRKRNIGEEDLPLPKKLIEESIEYIRNSEEIRDVLLTGGDPFTLQDEYIDWVLSELRTIPHLEIIRIGSRTPVTMPQRITKSLVEILKKYHPLYINTHFNNPKEITEESKKACEMLADAGIPLGNQAVLLNGVNNDRHIMKALNQDLLKIRVKPYYIFHAKHVKGTGHFNTSVSEGLEIMEYLRGYTSGLAIPAYIINAPGGYGKTPILPEYLISQGKNYITIRTWEGRIIKYDNFPTKKIEL